MKIEVTPKDIQTRYITALSNPISFAMQRVTGKMWYVFDGTSIRRMSEPLHAIPLPQNVSRWWQEYTNAKEVSSIEFELDIP